MTINFDDDSVYIGGSEGAWRMYNSRRKPMQGYGQLGLPQPDCDLEAAKEAIVIPASPYNFSFHPHQDDNYSLGLNKMAANAAGLTELELLHRFCIANLRKQEFPSAAKTLFHRIWREHGDFMVEKLETRWIISALATFADHGETENQRLIGAAMNTFFSLIKLYETERRISHPQPGPAYVHSDSEQEPMPVGLSKFSSTHGDLDMNMIGWLHQMTLTDQVAGFLGQALLYKLLTDQHNIFARLVKAKNPRFFATITAPAQPPKQLQPIDA